MDAKTGQILHETNADVSVFPASLTKMMTLYMAFQALQQGKIRLNHLIPVSRNAQRQEPSKLGLLRGETLTVHEAILAMVTKSANDASVAFAEWMAGSEAVFARQMTRQARRLGLFQTHFYTASGLPHKLQKTTARDMALLSQSLWRDFPKYCQAYLQVSEFEFRGSTHKNHNNLLGKVEGVDGIKTGFTSASGFHLAASAKRGNRRLIVVVIGGKNRFWRDAHTAELVNTAFEAPRMLASLTPPSAVGGGNSSYPSIPSLISKAAAQTTPLRQVVRPSTIQRVAKKSKAPRASIVRLIEERQTGFYPAQHKPYGTLKKRR